MAEGLGVVHIFSSLFRAVGMQGVGPTGKRGAGLKFGQEKHR